MKHLSLIHTLEFNQGEKKNSRVDSEMCEASVLTQETKVGMTKDVTIV